MLVIDIPLLRRATSVVPKAMEARFCPMPRPSLILPASLLNKRQPINPTTPRKRDRTIIDCITTCCCNASNLSTPDPTSLPSKYSSLFFCAFFFSFFAAYTHAHSIYMVSIITVISPPSPSHGPQ
jgi:hypothetical protein